MVQKRKTHSDDDPEELMQGMEGFREGYEHRDKLIKQQNKDREKLRLMGGIALHKQLERAGGVLVEQEVCDLLGIKSSELATLKIAGKLIVLTFDDLDFYPVFQFKQNEKIVDHFSEILGLLNSDSAVDSIQFFLVPESDLNDMTPIEAIKSESDLHLVKRLAKQFGRQVAR